MNKKNILLIILVVVLILFGVGGFFTYKKYFLERIEISGEVFWNDFNNKDGMRPSRVTIELYDGSSNNAIKTVSISKKEMWKYTFSGLPKYKKFKEIKYSIKEKYVNNYNINYNKYNITNKYSPSKIDITGRITWNDQDNKNNLRPQSITVELYNNLNSNPINSIIVTEDNNWEYTFDNLPQYRNGQLINYFVKAKESISNYEVLVDGYDIVNELIINDNPKTGYLNNMVISLILLLSFVALIFLINKCGFIKK